MDYLSFEKPIEELEVQLSKALELADDTGVDMAKSIDDIRQKLDEAKKKIYGNLSAWERVQLSRHPQRPYTQAYINAITEGNFIEMHGDRGVKDDKAMIGGWGMIGDQSYMFIGQQKGVNTKMRQYRNFGMANPEGYRKALRLMKQAEKFGRPIITL
ncbi:MAG: acetyl-CoA carboxylase carboxyl transferase subunit alpha, partial [Schleiferiaceae bacterium]|nr:acetyl-CoA carboxylase carboxyl transferase subunit alpha [Schleiferiaceae bacterium]